jgi:hypothetical protein
MVAGLQLWFGPISLGTHDVIGTNRFPITSISPKIFDLRYWTISIRLACGWHVIFFANNTVLDIALDTALDMALTQLLQFPSLVTSFIFLAFACLSAAERFLAPGSSTY